MASRPPSAIFTPAKRAKVARKAVKKKTTQPRWVGGTVSFGLRPLPLTVRNRLKYSATHTISTSGGLGAIQFAANDVQHPGLDFSPTGVNPLYFNRLAELYAHVRVYASRMYVTPLSDIPVVYGISIFDQQPGSTALPLDLAFEAGRGVQAVFNSAGTTKTLIKTWGTSQQGNIQDTTWSWNQTSDQANGPADAQNYNLAIKTFGLSDIVIPFQINIEYDCEWTELNSVGPEL